MEGLFSWHKKCILFIDFFLCLTSGRSLFNCLLVAVHVSFCLFWVLGDCHSEYILLIYLFLVRLDSDWHSWPQIQFILGWKKECCSVYFIFTECPPFFSISAGNTGCLWHFQMGQLFCHRLTASDYSDTVANLLSNMYTQIMFLTFLSFRTNWQSEPHTVNIPFNLVSFPSSFANEAMQSLSLLILYHHIRINSVRNVCLSSRFCVWHRSLCVSCPSCLIATTPLWSLIGKTKAATRTCESCSWNNTL